MSEEIRSLNPDILDIEELERRIEMSQMLPIGIGPGDDCIIQCPDNCQGQCTMQCTALNNCTGQG